MAAAAAGRLSLSFRRRLIVEYLTPHLESISDRSTQAAFPFSMAEDGDDGGLTDANVHYTHCAET
jgi:hypothetical protein